MGRGSTVGKLWLDSPNSSWLRKCFSSSSSAAARTAVVGAYTDGDGNFLELTPNGTRVDAAAADQVSAALRKSGLVLKQGKCLLLTGVSEQYPLLSVVGLGQKEETESEVDENEGIETVSEKYRTAVASGVWQILSQSFPKDDDVEIDVDSFASTKCKQVGEGAEMATYDFDDFKTEKKPKPRLKLMSGDGEESGGPHKFHEGRILGAAQNLARSLMDTPANHMTPCLFAEKVEELFKTHDKTVKVVVRDQAWAESMKMSSFISVSRGAGEPLRFVEIHYDGGEAEEERLPLALVGKGVTFDTGGISIKPSAGMQDMKADMGGAAVVVAVLKAVADLNLAINIKAFIPLCENMPSGSSTKPGDVVTAMNGKTIQVDNTDAEGRLILADALSYATSHFKPLFCIDLATLTGAMAVALGGSAAGVFTNSSSHWLKLQAAGVQSGDRVWRMPLWKMFTEQMKESGVADLNNISSGAHAGKAGSCTAAGFLREFVDFDSCPNWMHIDVAGVMGAQGGEVPYLSKKGMAGRPVRTLVYFIQALSEENRQ